MSAWRSMRLGEFVRVQRGYDLPERERRAGNVPVMGSAGQSGTHDTPAMRGPGVVIGRSGASYGVVSWCDGDYWPLNTALFVTDFLGNDPRFSYYFLRALDLSGYNVGSAQPSLNRNHIYPIPICVPNRKEQRSIGSLLGGLDDKIALNRRMNHTLDLTATSLFQSWFVDFEPVTARAEERPAVGVPAPVYQAMPTDFVDAEEGVIPEGWTWEPLERLLRVTKDGISPGETPESIFDHYSIPAFDERELPAREAGTSIRSGKFRVPEDAVLVSKLNPQTPRIWWPATAIHDRSVCSTEFMPCVPRNGVRQEFLYELLRSPSFAEEMATLVTGTSNSHQRVKPDDFLRLSVVRPSEAVMRGFAELVGPLLERRRHNLLENATLATLRDTLLPQLLSGTIRLRDAEETAGAVA